MQFGIVSIVERVMTNLTPLIIYQVIWHVCCVNKNGNTYRMT